MSTTTTNTTHLVRSATRLAIFGLAAGAVGAVIWRRQARNLPCPSSLSFLLENPYFNRVAGPELLLDRAGVAPGMRVLDAGCGPGRLTLPAARRVGLSGAVVALDIQPSMLERVGQKLTAQGVTNVTLLQAGLGDGRTEPASFDRAFLVTVLGEIPDGEAALREIYAALKPGGMLSITEVLPDPDFQSPGAVRRLAEAAGFGVAAQFGRLPAYTLNLVKPG